MEGSLSTATCFAVLNPFVKWWQSGMKQACSSQKRNGGSLGSWQRKPEEYQWPNVWSEECGRTSFHIVIKHHTFLHLAKDAWFHWCFKAEDYVGHISTLTNSVSMGVKATRLSQKVAPKHRILVHLLLTRQGFSLQKEWGPLAKSLQKDSLHLDSLQKEGTPVSPCERAKSANNPCKRTNAKTWGQNPCKRIRPCKRNSKDQILQNPGKTTAIPCNWTQSLQKDPKSLQKDLILAKGPLQKDRKGT